MIKNKRELLQAYTYSEWEAATVSDRVSNPNGKANRTEH